MQYRPARRKVLTAALAAAALSSLAGCGGGAGARSAPAPIQPPATPQFVFEGLSGRTVNRLRPAGAGVLAATDAGVFRRVDGSWQPGGLAELTILDVVALSGDRWLASGFRTADGATATPRLMKTVDGGASWAAVENDFGGPGESEALQALAFDAARQRLLATGVDVLAESRDEGRSWTVLHGDWQRFARPKAALAVHGASGDAWYGGQDAIEGLVLFHRAEATRAVKMYSALLPSPSVVKGLQFPQAHDATHIVVSGEGGVVETRDGGASWATLLRDGYNFYFDVAVDPATPSRLVTARWQKNFDTPQPLHVVVSDDAGRSWRVIQHPDEALFGGTRALLPLQEAGRTVVLLGLHKGGVMRLQLPDR